MANGALVLVDAAEGPMPQTRFVLTKALECRLQPLVVINKIDRPDARPAGSAGRGLRAVPRAGRRRRAGRLSVHLRQRPRWLCHARSAASPAPRCSRCWTWCWRKFRAPRSTPMRPLQMLVTTLDWSDYVGRIAVGRIFSGRITRGQQVALMQAGDRSTVCKVASLLHVRQAGPQGSARSRSRRHRGGGRSGGRRDRRHDQRRRRAPLRCRAWRSTSRRCK